MSSPSDRGKRSPHGAAPDAATIPSDPELANAPTVAATFAVDGKRKRADPFTLVSGESVSPLVETHGAEMERTGGANRYEPGPIIGAGGMGEVRIHVDRRIGRRVAKKTLHSTLDSTTARVRFVREARIQGQLEHPAIVPVYDLDVDEDGHAFFTMKRIRGETLERVLERLRQGDVETTKRFSLRKLLTAFTQVCLAIDYAHTRGVLHRDLKPGNVMLGAYGEVYVLDWGLAKVVGEPDDDEEAAVSVPPASVPVVGASGALTRRGSLIGTPAYMAPEQLLRKTDDIDARTDVFALGAILFEIVTRTSFRKTTDLDEILIGVQRGERVRPSERVDNPDDIPPEIDEICARALAKKREDRPEHARDLAEAVERFLDGEYDTNLRRELAAKHAADARTRPRVEAFRETMKALALDPDNEVAQKLFVDLLTDVSGDVPAKAQHELQAATDQSRATSARAGGWGLLLWLATFPAMVLIGVRSWPVVLTLAGVTLAGVIAAFHLSKRPRFSTGAAIGMAATAAVVVALSSCYLGPFAVVPTCAATAVMLFTMNATRRERPIIIGLLTLGAFAPYIAEISGIFPRAYAFEADRIVVFARAVALPEGATMAAMIYSSLSFTVLAGVLMGRMRDALRVAERRHFLQAFYLREIFHTGEHAT